MSVSISPMRTKGDFRQFLKLPYNVYRGQMMTYPAWVPPLNIDVKHVFDRVHNSFYEHADLQAFLARRGDRVLGRIAAIIDQSFCNYQGTKTGFIGFFEALQDDEVAAELFTAAEGWLHERGMERIICPVNGSTNKQIGNQIDSFDTPPVIEMPYSPPYYMDFYDSLDYGKAVDLYSYRMSTKLKPSEKILRVAEITRMRHRIDIRKVNVKDWNKSVNIVRDIWDDAWADNWGYVPWNKAEFDQLAGGLKMAMDPDITLFAFIDNQPVGFAFPIPDLNTVFHGMNGKLFPFGIFKLLVAKSRVKTVRIAAFGVRKAYQNKGVDALLIHELHTRGVNKGYSGAEFSWILEENLDIRNLLENWGAKHYRTHRLYEKEL